MKEFYEEGYLDQVCTCEHTLVKHSPFEPAPCYVSNGEENKCLCKRFTLKQEKEVKL